jgi:hypothetical protein
MFPIVYTKSNNDIYPFNEAMSVSFDVEPLDKEIVVDTYIDLESLIGLIIRPLVASDNTIIETQTIIEHGDFDIRSQWIIDLPLHVVIKIIENV